MFIYFQFPSCICLVSQRRLLVFFAALAINETVNADSTHCSHHLTNLYEKSSGGSTFIFTTSKYINSVLGNAWKVFPVVWIAKITLDCTLFYLVYQRVSIFFECFMLKLKEKFVSY